MTVSHDTASAKEHLIAENSVKLVLMRWRTGYLCALVASIAFTVLAISAWHPCSYEISSSGIAAPAIPAATIESGFDAKLLPQFHGSGNALLASLSFAPVTISTRAVGQHNHQEITPTQYGPLHRRPPPNFS